MSKDPKDYKDEPAKVAVVPAPAPAPLSKSAASGAFSKLSSEVDGGVDGDFEKLSHGGKDAIRAFASLDKDDERYEGAKKAALDAIRDHQRAGWPAQPQTTPADPELRNTAPTGTQGETSGNPATANTPPAAPPPPPTEPKK